MPKTGKETSSTEMTSTKLARALPRNSAAPEMGAAIRASRQSLGTSRAKLRFNTSVPAKANTIHSKPPDISTVSCSPGSKAKLNRTSMTSEKASEALMASLGRKSVGEGATGVQTCALPIYPQQAAGHFDGLLFPGIEGETEQDQYDQREGERSVDGFLGAELRAQVFSGDHQRLPEEVH